MASAIILGDVHLGKSVNIGKIGVGANLNSRITDQLNLLDWILDQAVELHADHIIITGDVFEEPKPAPYLITLFIDWLKKCQVYNIHIHLILGNHDILRSGYIYTSPLDIITSIELDNVDVYKDITTIFIETSAFTFLPFRDRKSFASPSNAEALQLLKNSLVYELASIPSTYNKIIVGHLAIEGSIAIGDEIDDISNELFCPTDMFTGYDYVWMGHVHKPQVMKKSSPYIAHIGSMDVSNFGETDHKKHIIAIDCLNKESLTIDWKKIELPTRNLKKISIVIPKETTDTTSYVLSELKKIDDFEKSIVKIDISLATPDLQSVNKSSIEKYLMERGTFNITGISEAKKIALVKKDSNNIIDTKMDIVSAIKTYSSLYVEEEMRADVIELALQIYNEYKLEIKE